MYRWIFYGGNKSMNCLKIHKRLVLFGHILRLEHDTPAQRAIKYYVTPHKRPVGRPLLTWMALITKDLHNTLKHQKNQIPPQPPVPPKTVRNC